MYDYFVKNGYQGPLYYSAIKAWLETMGFTFSDYHREGEAHCRYIYINGQLSGECWVNHREEIDNATLEYIGDNDLMQYCDATL